VSLYIQREVEIYKDNLTFPHFSIRLSGQATQQTNEKIGEKGEKLGTRFSFLSSSLLRKIQESVYLANV